MDQEHFRTMMRYLKHEEIDKERWDETVSRDVTGLPYGLSCFLDVLTPGWEALVAGDYSLIFPLPVKKKAGLTFMLQPPFLQQLGPFSLQPPEEHDIRQICEALPRRIRYADIHLNEKTPPTGWCGKVNMRRNILLDLQGDVSALTKAYHENTRRNIRKFDQASLDVTEEEEAFSAIIQCFSGGQGKQYRQIRAPQYVQLEKLLRTLSDKGMIEVDVVRGGKELLAGAVFIRWRQRYIFYFSATTARGREVHALSGILDRFIRKHAGSRMILDMEGSQAEGLARFYKGFGGREVRYPRLVINRLPWPLALLKR